MTTRLGMEGGRVAREKEASTGGWPGRQGLIVHSSGGKKGKTRGTAGCMCVHTRDGGRRSALKGHRE